ncbi:hypothetical protein [Actinoplanes campanulatus]|uniref:hypothetical protein n=3 Tax=Actinoplanes campanulatus TaxID=113559 RepID=UPI0031E46C11
MTAASPPTTSHASSAGPGRRSGSALADELTTLAERTPELHPVRADLLELAIALRSAEPDGGWADLDVVGIYARPESIGTSPGRSRSWRSALEEAPALLVFFPVLVTWLGLAAATVAYGRMLADPAGRELAEGRSFLQLWQEGFDGRLPSMLTFGHVAMLALAVIGLLIVVTLGSVMVRRGDEARQARRTTEVGSRLRSVLVRCQIELNRRRLASPARFAAELSQAAHLLGELLTRTSEAQRGTADLAQHNSHAAERLAVAIDSLREAVGTLDRTGAEVREATAVLQSATAVLRDDLTVRASAAAERLDSAGEQAAAQVRALQAGAQATLRDASARIDRALGDVADRIDASTGALRAAGDEYARTISDAARRASVEIGEFYGEAVATAAVSLAGRMAEIGAGLSDAVATVRASAERNAEAVRSVQDAYAGLTATMAEAAGASQRAAESTQMAAASTREVAASTLSAATATQATVIRLTSIRAAPTPRRSRPVTGIPVRRRGRARAAEPTSQESP